MNCQECNKPVETEAVFCGNCGSKVVIETAPSVESGNAKKFWKFIFYLALIIGGILLIVALGPLWIIAVILFFILLRIL